jgi:hypothetical protein
VRKDHLRLVTDAGASLDLGWDYGIPYQIDNLSGVDVTLKTAQGVNQQGVTVEGQSVEGVSHEVIADFWGPEGERQANLFLQKLPFFTSGTMYFGDAYFSRFVLQKTPYTVQLHPYPRLDFMLYRPKPYWYSLTSQSAVMGGFIPRFQFPVCYDSHQYSEWRQSYFLNVRNPGALPVPFTATLRSTGSVVNPAIRNSVTGEFIGFELTLGKDETLEIYRTTTDRLAVKLVSGGTETNAFYKMDEDSDLTELHPGDNILTADADSGKAGLQASISFYPMSAGILPEVMR